MFVVSMNKFATTQQTSARKLAIFDQRFQIKEPVLKINDVKITRENAFNGDHLITEGNHK